MSESSALDFSRSHAIASRNEELIPGGSHTYSKGRDQFPDRSPRVLVRAIGSRTWDADGNEFVDWGMGLRSVILGHAYEPVLEAVREALLGGANLTCPTPIEGDLAERLVDLIPCAEMVKFSKNGSDVTSAALRLARAHTGRDLIAYCVDQPFFSFDDWFIGTTACSNGVPPGHHATSIPFRFNDLDSIRKVFANNPGRIAAVILEPIAFTTPAPGFLEGLRELTSSEGAVLVFDEMISGLRVGLHGAQGRYGVTPDLATFGKAIGNGFSVAALTGRRALMELGGLRHDQRRTFLLSATHGAETHALAAALRCLAEYERHDVANHIDTIGRQLMAGLLQGAREAGIIDHIGLSGYPASPSLGFTNSEGAAWAELRTLWLQEMIARGILAPYFAPALSHTSEIVEQTLEAARESFAVCARAIAADAVEAALAGPPAKPVFRAFN